MSGGTTLLFTEPLELRIPVPWGHVSAKAWGSPENKHLVLGLHGWMDNAGTFDRLVPHLTNSIYFVAVDLPGHGLSSHIPAGMPYHFGDYLITIRRITGYLKWSKFSIIGHSMGGAIGSFFASLYPKVVERVVLLDIIKPISYDDGVTPDSMSQAIDSFLSIEEKARPETIPSYSYEEALQRMVAATDEGLTEESAKCLLARGTIRVDEEKWAFRRDLRVRSPSIYRFDHEKSMSLLRNIKSDLLIIKGKDAPVFGGPADIIRKTMDLYKEKCNSFEYVEIQGNHFVHLNDPVTVSQLINNFFIKTRKASL